MGRNIGRPFIYDYKRSGGGIPNPPPRNSGGSEPDTLGALNGVPQFFRKNQFKDGINNKFSVVRGVPTELNRINTIRNFGMSEGLITNASPNVAVYKYQGYLDPQVSSMKYGSTKKNRKLYDRRLKQRKADNRPIIIDRPFN